MMMNNALIATRYFILLSFSDDSRLPIGAFAGHARLPRSVPVVHTAASYSRGRCGRRSLPTKAYPSLSSPSRAIRGPAQPGQNACSRPFGISFVRVSNRFAPQRGHL
jgi:hypothetical protein